MAQIQPVSDPAGHVTERPTHIRRSGVEALSGSSARPLRGCHRGRNRFSFATSRIQLSKRRGRDGLPMRLIWQQTYVHLAIPECWARLITAGATPAAAYAQLVTDHGIVGPVTVDDYGSFVDDLRAVHLPS